MILLITGSTHTGKTLLAQKLIEKYKFPCFSLDHLKMGLIRSGKTDLTPEEDDKITDLLWPIVREMMKTAIENHQNLIIEGCYFPKDWERSFELIYREEIKMICLIMTKNYINNHFDIILDHCNVIEHRIAESNMTKEYLIYENTRYHEIKQNENTILIMIDNQYDLNEIIKKIDDNLGILKGE